MPESEGTKMSVLANEPFHTALALLAAASFLGGIIFPLLASDGTYPKDDLPLVYIIAGALVVSAIAGTWVSNFWQRVDSLPPAQKAVAWAPVVTGTIAVAYLALVLIISILLFFVLIKAVGSLNRSSQG